jgi:chemotaxis protein methyltransferase WspC
MMPFSAVEELLRSRIGLDPDAAGRGLIARAARARMRALGLDPGETERYRRLLERSEPEFQALVDEVVVPESWFFRDSVPFELLADRARALVASDPGRAFRALSMPCAGGEEPYSIAIALLRAGVGRDRLRIDAVDISHRALATAGRAVYSSNAFRSVDLTFRDRYFHPSEAGYALDRSVADLVRFHWANLLGPGLLSGEPAYDAVFCRNLLIYLDGPARERALENVDRLLAPDGLLVVGHAERLGVLGNRFQPAGPKGSFAFERVRQRTGPALSLTNDPPPQGLPAPPARRRLKPAGPTRAGAPVHGVAGASSSEPWASGPRPRGFADETPAAQARSHEGFDRAGPRDNDRGQRLETATRLADAGRHEEAARVCEEEIRSGGPSAPAYFLLGMVRQAAGDGTQAERCFEKAVYLDGRHEDALLALALIAQRRGDASAAANYRRRAERAYREKPPT